MTTRDQRFDSKLLQMSRTRVLLEDARIRLDFQIHDSGPSNICLRLIREDSNARTFVFLGIVETARRR